MNPLVGTVYVLHFDERLAHARHYIGFAMDLKRRLARHHAGTSQARIIQVLRERGIGFRLAHTRPGTRGDERKLKRQHHSERFCPYCRAEGRVRKWGIPTNAS